MARLRSLLVVAAAAVAGIAGSADAANKKAAKSLLRINCGGEEYAASNGDIWSADKYFSNGLPAGNVRAGVGMADKFLYETARFDKRRQEPDLEYKLPVPKNGVYTVRLHFSDVFDSTAPGDRVFTIWAEEQLTNDGLDPRAMYGWMGGGMVDVSSYVGDGEMTIRFIRLEPAIQSPLVNAIELFEGTVVPAMATLHPPSPTIPVVTTVATTSGTSTTKTDTTVTGTTLTDTTLTKPPPTQATTTSLPATAATSICPPLSRYLYSGGTSCLCVDDAACVGEGCRGLVSLWYFDTVTCPDCKCVAPSGSSNLDGGDGDAEGECTDTKLPSGAPWHDGDGSAFSCNWFSDAPARCALLGGVPGAQGLTAKEACCVCGGGDDGSNAAVTAATMTTGVTAVTTPWAVPTECPANSTAMSGGKNCLCTVGSHCSGPKCRPLLSLGYWILKECPTCQCRSGARTTTATTRMSTVSSTTTATPTTSTADVCRRLTCGAWCTEPCGWSRMPRPGFPDGFCRNGSTTKPSEFTLGYCPNTTTSTTTVSSTSTTTPPDCSLIMCGELCTGSCGWSTKQSRCKLGAFTKAEELGLGDCSGGGNDGGQPPSSPPDTVDECSLIVCGAQCNGACGWSKAQNMCKAGAFTKESEKKLGDCSGANIGATTADPTTAVPATHPPTPPPPTVCVDLAISDGSAWADTDNDDCVWYASEPLACSRFGHLNGPEGNNANTMCCGCGGGTMEQGGGGQPLTGPKEELDGGSSTNAPTTTTASATLTTGKTTTTATAELLEVPWQVLPQRGAECQTSNLACVQLGWAQSSKSQRSGVCGVSIIAGQCQAVPVTYDEATDTCRSVGARLCSAAELKDDVTKETGCNYLDDVYVWTRRPCSDTSAIIATATGVGGVSAQCVRATAKFSFRCCADVSPENTCRVEPLTATPPTAAITVKKDNMCNPCIEGRNWRTDESAGCCYKHFTTKRSFSSAKEACAVFAGASMASVASRKEDEFITTIRSGTKDVWLGGMRVDKSTTAVEWMDGTAAFKPPAQRYTNWYPTEPNDDSDDSSCVAAGSTALYKRYGGLMRWNDANCRQKKGYVCKFCPNDHPSCTSSTTTTSATTTTKTDTTKTVTTITATTTTTLTTCWQIRCGLDCKNTDGRCGWSSKQKMCIPGAVTSALELTRGDCRHHSPSEDSNYNSLGVLMQPEIGGGSDGGGGGGNSDECGVDDCMQVIPTKPCQCDPTCAENNDCCEGAEKFCADAIRRAGQEDLDAGRDLSKPYHGVNGFFVGGVSFGDNDGD